MLKVVNFFRGYLEVRVSGPFPERFLNVCAESGVAFWRLRRTEEGDFLARVRPRGLETLRALAERALCTVKVERRVGAPFFFMGFRRRYAFVAGMAACIALVWTMSLRVWEFEVIGCETLDEGEVLAAMEELGVGVGTLRSDIDPDLLETQMLLRIDRLRWFAVNISGSRASVELRERTDTPEMLDRSVPQNIVARKAGVIERITVTEGKAEAAVGDTVTEGQLLVSGVQDLYNDEFQKEFGTVLVNARAEVTARTWYVLSAETPLAVREKRAGEGSTVKYTLVAGKKRINLFADSRIPYPECDKIIERTRVCLPGGFSLPLVIEKTTYRETVSAEAERDVEAAEDELRGALLLRLAEESGGAEVMSTDFGFEERDGMLSASLVAECREEIALPEKIPGVGNISEETQ